MSDEPHNDPTEVGSLFVRDLFVRDLFPQLPADRGSIAYPPPRDPSERLGPKPQPQPRRAFLRGEIARARRWWRRHWWPARIRDLEAELEYAQDELYGR